MSTWPRFLLLLLCLLPQTHAHAHTYTHTLSVSLSQLAVHTGPLVLPNLGEINNASQLSRACAYVCVYASASDALCSETARARDGCGEPLVACALFIYFFFYVRERESETGTARRCGLSSWFGLCSHALDVLDVNMCERAATRDTDVTQIVRYLNIFVILFYLQITQILNEMCTCQTKS